MLLTVKTETMKTLWSLVENKGKRPAQKINELLPSGSKTNPILTGDELLHKFENTSYFYKLGKCKFGKECKKEHPNSLRNSSTMVRLDLILRAVITNATIGTQ